MQDERDAIEASRSNELLGAALARKVLLFMGETQEDAVMTIMEDGSTAQELRDLAKAVLASESA